ncbi:MAG TPA: hypothetical protein VNV15_06340 [Opitutaceae bacterium]|jgi:hypothetical protein|nr:hypothetical protein [Opitutaceae bacterium]
MIPTPINYRFTREEEYREWIRNAFARKRTISFRDFTCDPSFQDLVFLSQDWRAIVEISAPSNPKMVLADFQQSLLFLDSLVIDKIVCPNAGLNLRAQLVIEVETLEWYSSTGEQFATAAVFCAVDGRIMVASKAEVPVVDDDAFWVDHFLYGVERRRLLGPQRRRRPKIGPMSYEL